MPLDSSIVGASTPAMEHLVDERWIMAYAASLADYNPAYMDTEAHKVLAHPVFPVCPEWPVILDTRNLAAQSSLTPQEGARGVHAAHDLHIFSPIQAGDRISTTCTMVSVDKIRPGAAYTMRLDTKNVETGELVARTYQVGIYRGVDIEGEPHQCEAVPELPLWQNPAGQYESAIQVPEGAAHTYTECARIWNPIHTDRAVALAAGLPDIILHGTATLALAVTEIVNRFAEGDPRRVVRLGGRFASMVLMPSTIRLQAVLADNVVSFQVITEGGDTAISQGFVCLS
ncbi:MAG: MaoC/PaaZ C-terminal domain-containing protein [Pseudomonadota bacterium]